MLNVHVCMSIAISEGDRRRVSTFKHYAPQNYEEVKMTELGAY